MTSLFTSIRLLSLKQYELNHTVDVDCIKVSGKYHCTQGVYNDAKREYFQSQCCKCERQWKLKRNIKYVDKLFRSYKCLFISWDLHQPLILFFSNGSIVTIELNSENTTLLKVDIDENLCGKLFPSRIIDVIICKNCLYVTYAEPKLTLIYINQDSPPRLAKLLGWKKGKVVGFEPKFLNFDLFVHSTKCVERNISLNTQKNLLLVWWRNSGDDVWPWTPITYSTERINMLIYSINGLTIELLYSIKVQDELLHATFSREHSHKFFSLEEAKTETEIVVHICVHEIVQEHCQIVHTFKLPVNGSLVAFDWSSTEDKLLASDADGLLLIYDVKTNYPIVNVTNLKFLPQHISWHPQTCIALVICKNNYILCVDAYLNDIDFKLCYKTALQTKMLELNTMFLNNFSIQKVVWQKSAFSDTCLLLLDSELSSFLLLKFSFGSISRHNVTSLELVSQYLKCNQLDRANLILMSLDWSSNSEMKFQCLSKIANHMLRKPLNFKTQACLEYALSSFNKWVDIIPKRVVETYGHQMHHLSRRFFHRLLRYQKFDKAFSLAIDLDSQDLFLDLYHVAKQKGESILAAVALRKAEEFDESSDSCSESCQSDSHSESAASYHNDTSSIDHNFPGGDIAYDSQVSTIPHISTSAQVGAVRDAVPSCSYSYREKTDIKQTHVRNSSNPVYQTHSHEIKSNLPLHYITPEPHSGCGSSTKEPHVLNDSAFSFSSKSICDSHKSPSIKYRESCISEEESEEVEGAQIKLAHLGII